MNSYVDKITHKKINFEDSTVFAIYTRVRNGKKILAKFYRAHDVDKAFNEFYALDISDNHRKYLQKHLPNRLLAHEGEVLISMKGYAPNPLSLRMKVGRKLLAYKKVATLNLINTPVAIAIKLRALDMRTLPLIPEKWTQTKVLYCMLSYVLSLPEEERNEVLKKAFLAYTADKLASGERYHEAEAVLESIEDDRL